MLLYFPKKHALKSYKTIEIIREVHKVLDDEPAFGAVTSLHTVEEWLGGGEVGEDRLIGFPGGEEHAGLRCEFRGSRRERDPRPRLNSTP